MSLAITATSALLGRLSEPQPGLDASKSKGDRKTGGGSIVVAGAGQSISGRTSSSLSALSKSPSAASQSPESANASSAANFQSDAEAALSTLEEMAATGKTTAEADAAAKLQKLLDMYEKLLVFADATSLAALGKDIAAAAKQLGESVKQADATTQTTNAPAGGSPSTDATVMIGATVGVLSNNSAPIPLGQQSGATPAAPSTLDRSTIPQIAAPVAAGSPPVEDATDNEAHALLNRAKTVLAAIKHMAETAEAQQKAHPQAAEPRFQSGVV
jgi:hypothetical protein